MERIQKEKEKHAKKKALIESQKFKRIKHNVGIDQNKKNSEGLMEYQSLPDLK